MEHSGLLFGIVIMQFSKLLKIMTTAHQILGISSAGSAVLYFIPLYRELCLVSCRKISIKY